MSGTLLVTNLKDGASATTNLTFDTAGSATVGNNLTVTGTTAMASSFKRNRLINGNMLIDQRNAGAQITAANLTSTTYMVDRWVYFSSQAAKFTAQQNAGSVTTAAGFSNYLGMTVATAVAVGAGDLFNIGQSIEGFNFADLAWGTSSAKTVTLSFVVYSSLTGTFGGVFRNSAVNRSYPFTYSIPAANTWTTISVTVAGDTSGTWVGATNGTGVQILFGLGVGSTYSGTAGAWASANYLSATGAVSVVGTSGATFYLTGVQLEVGTKATPYEMQIYSDQLAQCQRYYTQLNAATNFTTWGTTLINSSSSVQGSVVRLPVSMRATPTMTYLNVRVYCPAGAAALITSVTGSYNSPESLGFDASFSTSVMTAGQPGTIQANNTTSAYIAANAEL